MADLSVTFLVKNPPIDRFALLIEYLRVLATEIVVVSTGITDKQRAAIESWSDRFDKGVKIIDHEWKDDFSEARNVGVDACTGDWILILDPDELPSASMMAHIKAVLDYDANRPHALGWVYWSVNYWDGVKGPEVNYHWHVKMFKRGHGKFYRKVHELIALDGRPESETRGTPVCPLAPPLAYLIHSKAGEDIELADALYAKLGSTSR